MNRRNLLKAFLCAPIAVAIIPALSLVAPATAHKYITLMELARRTNNSHRIVEVINLLSETNEILSNMKWR